MEESTEYSPSLKHRLKNSFSACFKNNQHQHHHNHNNNNNININSPQHHHHQHQKLLRSTSGGATGMMRHIMNRIGTPHRHGHNHRKSKSTDFRYDPHSYTLNFDDDDNAGFHDFPFRDFSSRLPPSPSSRARPQPTRLNPPQPPPPAPSSPREIVACS